MKVQLIVVQGKPVGKAIPINGSGFKIGRGEKCNLRPNSDQVSREHMEIVLQGDTVAVRDLGSRNGTFLNGKRLSEPGTLKNGDLLQVGPLTFAVSIQGTTAGTDSSGQRPGPGKAASLDDVSHDQIEGWLIADENRPAPESPSAVYGGDTQTFTAFKAGAASEPTRSGETPVVTPAQPAAAAPTPPKPKPAPPQPVAAAPAPPKPKPAPPQPAPAPVAAAPPPAPAQPAPEPIQPQPQPQPVAPAPVAAAPAPVAAAPAPVAAASAPIAAASAAQVAPTPRPTPPPAKPVPVPEEDPPHSIFDTLELDFEPLPEGMGDPEPEPAPEGEPGEESTESKTEEYMDESNPFFAKKKVETVTAKPSSRDSSDAARDILHRLMERRKSQG